MQVIDRGQLKTASGYAEAEFWIVWSFWTRDGENIFLNSDSVLLKKVVYPSGNEYLKTVLTYVIIFPTRIGLKHSNFDG